MTPAASRFIFDGNLFDTAKDFVANIPGGLRDRNQLFAALSQALQFPDYFGNNWNALWDCLGDLSWIKHRRVVIKHGDLPQLDAETLSEYLDVLLDSVQDWKPGEDHELYVVFPENTRDGIVKMIRDRGRSGHSG